MSKLSPSKYSQKSRNTAVKNVNEEEYKQAMERENKYRNYLREESQKLRAKWQESAANVEKLRANGTSSDKILEKSTKSEKMYKKFANMSAEERQRAIREVEEIIWRDTAKPRELQSAALLGEVLKMQAEQRQQMRQVRMLSLEQKTQTARELLMQSQQWCDRQRQRTFDERKRAAEYKKDLQRLIEERDALRRHEREQQLRLEQTIGKINDKEWTEQKNKSEMDLKRKKNLIHRHALEAIKIKDDTLKRDQMRDSIEGKMIQLYHEGRRRITDFMQEKAHEKQSRRDQLKDIISGQFINIQPRTEQIEEEQIKRALVEQEEAFRVKAEKEKEAERRLKRERFQAQLEEMACLRGRKAEAQKDRRLSVENRLENFHVTAKHHEMAVKERTEEVRRMREALERQVAEKRERERRRRQEEIDFTNRVMVEEAEVKDAAFGKFSERLAGQARVRGEPLLPLERAKDAYNTLHSVTRRPIPPHLVDNVPINPKSYTGTNW
ncbi:trichohyalin [Phlebotomus argentipes]|uniref:trichohyalin n=1 Tax=Phlebotomus argentipes TaxID=94469 RepID=UPI0028931AE8|nr:trichohyalin [Phlebotomus argentipes]